MQTDETFYKGFEGEPEMVFSLLEDGVLTRKFSVWDGYFSCIMSLIRPEEGWTGLAYYYNRYIGWYEEEHWRIPDLAEAYGQLEKLCPGDLRYEEAGEVLAMICNLLKRAIDHGGTVYIDYF
ncbi:MAG: hypothetical protein K1W26_15995 [Acetatifactor sp.]